MVACVLVRVVFAGVKQCEFAGSFYPRDKNNLSKMIDEFLARAEVSPPAGDIIGIIAPHAGYIYSGPVAAYSYKVITGEKFDTAIIMGPSHRYAFRGVSVYPEGKFTTPLGNFTIDKETTASLSMLGFVSKNTEHFVGEHSLEVQLPFLKKVCPDCKIVPLVFGKVALEEIKKLGAKLKEIAKKKRLLVVVSTDLSHYHPYRDAKTIDGETIKHIAADDVSWLWVSFQLKERRACGMLPLITLLVYAKERGADIRILKYANSGDTAGGKGAVVGYVSAVVYVPEKKMQKEKKGEIMGLTKEEKRILLGIARRSLESFLKEKRVPRFEVDSETLKEKRAVFVTLKKKGHLRGCIGRIVPDTPLYEAVSRVAIDSAVNDPRFVPVKYEELKDIEIEISVMTPFERVNNLDEIEVGRHGLMIHKGFHSGLLLPQVPLEYGWDRKTFLEHLCYKAGLPPNAYKDKDTVIYKFSAEVFSEGELQEEE